jgi:hypothetical protein
LVNFFNFFVLKVEKTVFLQNFKANCQWFEGNMKEMVVYCNQLTLGMLSGHCNTRVTQSDIINVVTMLFQLKRGGNEEKMTEIGLKWA